MTVRLGTNPIGWSNDDLRSLGGATPLATCLREARAAGFAGIELGHKFPRTPEALRDVLSVHELALISGWYSSALLERDAEAELAAMRPHLDLLKALGCTILIIAETTRAVHGERNVPLSHRPVLAEAEWRVLAPRLTCLAQSVAKEGVAVAYHHHMGTVVQTEVEIDRLMADTGECVRLLLDTGHATFAGVDAAALAQRHRARIAHVHCKDVRREMLRTALAEDWSFLDSVIAGAFTVPGDGMVDFAAVLGALNGYDGWLVVEAEQDPAKADPATYARLGAANLRRFARACGLLAE